MPVKIKSDEGFAVLTNQPPTCDFSQHIISCSQPMDMILHLFKHVNIPVNKFDAVDNAYVDRIKYETTTDIIHNIAIRDHILFTFSTAKAFPSGKIIICEMWVERSVDE